MGGHRAGNQAFLPEGFLLMSEGSLGSSRQPGCSVVRQGEVPLFCLRLPADFNLRAKSMTRGFDVAARHYPD